MSEKVSDTLLKEVRDMLTELSIPYEKSENGVWVDKADDSGFQVGILKEAKEYTVYFDVWHDHFELNESAKAKLLFFLGLTPMTRLKAWFAGDNPYKFSGERLIGGNWVQISTMGVLLFPFWRKRRIEVFRNSMLRELPSDIKKYVNNGSN